MSETSEIDSRVENCLSKIDSVTEKITNVCQPIVRKAKKMEDSFDEKENKENFDDANRIRRLAAILDENGRLKNMPFYIRPHLDGFAEGNFIDDADKERAATLMDNTHEILGKILAQVKKVGKMKLKDDLKGAIEELLVAIRMYEDVEGMFREYSRSRGHRINKRVKVA